MTGRTIDNTVTEFKTTNVDEVTKMVKRHMYANYDRVTSQEGRDWLDRMFDYGMVLHRVGNAVSKIQDALRNQGKYKGHIEDSCGIRILDATVNVEKRAGTYHGRLYHGKGQ
jgi:hypothetical protein